MAELASPVLASAISPMNCESILLQMCDNGCKIETVPIGYDD